MKLRTRLWIGFTLIVLVVVGAGVFTVEVQRRQLYDQIDDRLITMPLPPETRVPPPGAEPAGRPDTRAVVAPDDRSGNESISDVYVAVIHPDGTTRDVIVGQLLDDLPDLGSFVDDPPAGSKLTNIESPDGTGFRAIFLPGETPTLDTVVAVPVDDVDESLRTLTLTFVAMAGLVLLASLGIASWVSRHGIRPINDLAGVAEAISSGNRDRRAEVTDETTEAGHLGRAFNVMLDERDRDETRLRQFVSNASHELRTPLTSIRGYVDLYRAGGFRGEGELDEAMRRLHLETERMSRLAEDLLVLAKFDEAQALEWSAVRVDTVADDVVALVRAAHPGRAITADAPDPVVVDADRFRLHQALTAVVDNAVKHTPPDSSVIVTARRHHDRVTLAVIDDGPGLTDAEAAAVFDRFTRGETSRSRAAGGSGLGLSIARSIVDAHGGEIGVTATPGEGATFTIDLPTPTD